MDVVSIVPDEKMEDYNFEPDGDFVSVNTEFILYENKNHRANPRQEKTKQKGNHTEKLLSKYVKIAQTFCKDHLNKHKQSATRAATQEYLEKVLKKSNESLGPNSRLPERSFRKIWNAVPGELRRKRGVTTRS